MKPRSGRLSDLQQPAQGSKDINTGDSGAVKAALLVTVTLLIASNVGWAFYYVNRQRRIAEQLTAQKTSKNSDQKV